MLVNGVLAVLLPTEDLENDSLVALVGQIFSELIVGRIVADRLSEPWLIWEGLIILSRVVRERTNAAAAGTAASAQFGQGETPAPAESRKSFLPFSFFSPQRLFWALVRWAFLAAAFVRLLIRTAASSRGFPSRMGERASKHQEQHATGRKMGGPALPQAAILLDTDIEHAKVPVLAFRIFPVVSNLIEMDVRMPWLSGALSLLHWMAIAGPGRIADVDGILDR